MKQKTVYHYRSIKSTSWLYSEVVSIVIKTSHLLVVIAYSIKSGM